MACARRRAVRVILFALAIAPAGTLAHPSTPVWLWRQTLHGWGEPAADGGSAFVLTREHEVVALAAATGAIRWRVHTGGDGKAPWGSAVRLWRSLVIVGDDAIVAFDRSTGRQVWRFVPREGPGIAPFIGDVVDGVLLAGSSTGRVHGIDLATGVERWARRVAPPEARTATVFAPIVVGRTIVASYTTFTGPLSGGLVALDLHGRRLWHRRLVSGAGGAPAGASGIAVVAATNGLVHGFSTADGHWRWTLPKATPRQPRQELTRDVRPIVARSGLVVVGSLTGEFAAYDAATVHERWRFSGGPEGAAALRVAADGSTLYIPYTDGSLVALEMASGRERWRTDGRSTAIEWPPGLGGGRVVAAGDQFVGAVAIAGTGGEAAASGPTREDE
jgi:outer membrane protein assembly factor BamB